MQTRDTSEVTTPMTDQARRTSATQKVLIVNGSGDVLEALEPALGARDGCQSFVESSAHAYSQIKRVRPDLVILCVEIDDAEGLNVLSMLKLDSDTRDIPVVTYTSAGVDESAEDEDDPEPPMFPSRPALLMN